MSQVLNIPQIPPFANLQQFKQQSSFNNSYLKEASSNPEQIKQLYEQQQALQYSQMSKLQLIMNMLPQFDEKANYYQEFVKVCITNDFLHNQVNELFQDRHNLSARIQDLEKSINEQSQQNFKQPSSQNSSQYTDAQLKKMQSQQNQQQLIEAQQVISQHCRQTSEEENKKKFQNNMRNQDQSNATSEDSQCNDEDSERFKKKNRRCAQEIEKGFLCPYDNCSKSYGSDVSLNLHIKIKHNGGSKTEREKLAKTVMLAKINKQEIPKLDIQFPPGYLENFEELLKKEFINKSQSNYSSENLDSQENLNVKRQQMAEQDSSSSTQEQDIQEKKIKQE